MADEDAPRAKRAAEASEETSGGRPKRFLTPDWDDWDAASGDSPDEAPPASGGRFATGPQEEPPAPAPGRARHSWADDEETAETEPSPVQPSPVQASAGQPSPEEPSEGPEQGTRAWRPIPVEPAPGASRAAQPPSLGEKRRREAPALPSTPPPTSPSERREVLIARERAGRAVAPGSVPGDDWTDAPLPASAVPPPAAGQSPTPIAVHEGETPVEHHAYTRPADEPAEPSVAGGTPASSVGATGPTPAAAAFVPPPPAPAQAQDTAPAEQPPVAPSKPVTPGETPPVEPPVVASDGRQRHGVAALLRRRPIQIGAAALVLVVVLIAGFLVFANRKTPSAAASSQTSAALVERLVTADQLSGVGPGGWSEQKTEPTVTQDSAAPLCYVPSPDLPTPNGQAQRKLAAAGATLLHRITSYATAAEAEQVYTQRLTQLGQCSNIPVYLTSGATVTSLGDAAAGVTAVIQDTTAQYHTVVLVRTGSMLLTYDLALAGSAVPYDKVLPVAAQTVSAICSSAGGGCAASPTATTGIPPASSVPGWLTVSDLPRLTPGMGRWNATAPKTTVTSAGSACENLTFATVAGPEQRRQRTYLLTEDTKVPKDFGLDEIVLDFPTPDAAAAFAAQLKTSIADCPNRTATAKLGNTADITAKGVKGETVTGFWRTVTQSTSPSTSFIFRVGVASVGTRVVYLLLTPSASFDYTDADWAAITTRAGQRATQGG